MVRRVRQPGIGVDVVDISRFKKILSPSKKHLLQKLFTDSEILYCKSFKDLATHFAGHFAAKEAACKALGVKIFPFMELEIKHDKDGAPEIWKRRGKNLKKLPVQVSISHTKNIAVAIALSNL